jgi:PAS domain S-box-containing protein
MIRRVLLPLARFQETVRSVAGGDLTVRVASTAKDELGELSRTFDAMAVVMVADLRQQVAERQEAEERARRKGQLYAVLSQCNHAIVHSRNADELFQKVCSAAISLGGMKMAWIGWVDPATQAVQPVARCGDEHDYLAQVKISMDAASPLGQGPTGTAIRDDQPFWCQDFLSNPHTAPWYAAATRAGWAASASLPVHRDGKVVGALNLYAGDRHAFDEDFRQLLLELATDISFALDVFARKADHQASELRYRRLFEAAQDGILILNAVTGVIEDANPYLLELMGYTHEELVGRNLRDLSVLKFGIANAEAFAVLQSQDYVRYEDIPLETKTGKTLDVEFISNIYLVGNARVIQCNIRDISARKHADDRQLEQLDELRRWQQATLGREDRILTIKKEVNQLLAAQGQPPRYPSVQDEEAEVEGPR